MASDTDPARPDLDVLRALSRGFRPIGQETSDNVDAAIALIEHQDAALRDAVARAEAAEGLLLRLLEAPSSSLSSERTKIRQEVRGSPATRGEFPYPRCQHRDACMAAGQCFDHDGCAAALSSTEAETTPPGIPEPDVIDPPLSSTDDATGAQEAAAGEGERIRVQGEWLARNVDYLGTPAPERPTSPNAEGEW